MSKGNTFENDWMKLVFNGTAIANIADNASSSPLTNLYFAIHTSDPGEAGDQSSNEATYGAYARVAVPRSTSGFTVTNNAVTNAALIQFPTATSGSNTISHFSIGTSSSGAGKILYSGALGASLTVSTGITPAFAAGDLDGTED